MTETGRQRIWDEVLERWPLEQVRGMKRQGDTALATPDCFTSWLGSWAGIATHDIYQLHAYGQRYLGGRGDLALVYPDHEQAPALQGPIKFEGCGLFLHLLSFSMKTDTFQCHPSFQAGDWYRRQ